MTWALPEWTVLAALRERPRHGFAIAALTEPDGELGRVWQLPRPVVYRALGRLASAEHIAPTAVESGPGPQRTVYDVTPAGRALVDEWLIAPVPHIRELRSHLLMKLALLDRRGVSPAPLIAGQRAVLARIESRLAAERAAAGGFDAVLATWRHTNAVAALQFLDDLS